MSVLLKTVRISGFRGLENLEVQLELTTVLTGMNNTGKTSFLKAIQLALGNRQFISQDDFFIKDNTCAEKIIIDLLIVPIDTDGNQAEDFSQNWLELFTEDRIRVPDGTNSLIPLRTIITFDAIKNSYKSQQTILGEWPALLNDGKHWFDSDNGKKTSFHFDEFPFFYIDAQRDILEDTKLRSSYLGKMMSKIEYSKDDIKEIEAQIKLLNDKAVSSSDILSNIKETLKGLDSAMDSHSEGVEITPFTKKIRDLNKGLTIYYNDSQESLPMEYHGMGTRSWSSLLTLKSFISLLASNADNESSIFLPILAIEEPEAHLHPNAQKKLYGQINSIVGQKIISTHSPYIAATAELEEIRSFYKNKQVSCGNINIKNLTPEEIRKIKRQVINSRGEIFFSKLIIFFEGETEEQALPIFSEKYFGKTPVEMGLDFIGVGGNGNYLPFLRFSEALNIPWLIFSDAETNVVTSVKEQYTNSHASRSENESIVFIDDGNDFEKQLISDGFAEEIKCAIISRGDYHNEQHKKSKESEVDAYDNDKLYEIITGSKTQFGPAIAEQIVESDKDLPPKVVSLFEKIKSTLKIGEDE